MPTGITIADLAPPFPLVTLPSEDMQCLNHELKRFGARWAMFSAATEPAARKLTLAWFEHCCPPGARREALAVAGRLLYTWYWFHDHKDDPAYEQQVRDFWSVLQGREPVTSSPLTGAASEVAGDLAALVRGRGMQHTRLFHFLGRTLAAFLWDRAHRGREPVSVADYEAERTHTIFVQPWMELWRRLEGDDGLSDVLYGTDLEHLERAVRRHHYLANDICSVTRDLASGKQNIVRSRMHEADVTMTEALDWGLHELEGTSQFISMRSERMLTVNPTPWLGWYVRFLRSCTRGNVEVMVAFSSRYEVHN